MQIYNSRDKSYKSIISAIATNEKCKFRIIVPRDVKCCGACLAITKENEQTAYYNMFWAMTVPDIRSENTVGKC